MIMDMINIINTIRKIKDIGLESFMLKYYLNIVNTRISRSKCNVLNDLMVSRLS